MFEDVAEMEREIEAFRKNMVASSELVEGISRLTAETKSQKDSFSASTAELTKKLDACIEQFKSDNEAAMRTMSYRNDTAIKTLQKNMSAEQDTRVAELERIQAEFRKNLADATEKSEVQQNAFVEKLQSAEEVFKDYQSTAESKYNEFVNRLETTNVDQIYKEMQDLKKSIQTKFAILMGGVGITIAIPLLSMLLN